jgi:hypothetical protein
MNANPTLLSIAATLLIALAPPLNGRNHGGQNRAESSPAADLCSAPLPANRALPTAGGIKTYTVLRGGGMTFYLNQLGPQGLDTAVRQLGAPPPPGDAVATWSLSLTGGTRIYSGLTHVFTHGAHKHVCLQGTAFLNLGNGMGAATAPAVQVILDGSIADKAAHVDAHVDRALYVLSGKPHIRSASVGPSIGDCQPAQVDTVPDSSSAGAGHVGLQLRLHNHTAATCTLYGYPGPQLLDAQKHPLPTSVRQGNGYLAGSAQPEMVYLIPDSNAYFVLEWVHVPAPGQSCPRAANLLITLPSAHAAELVSLGRGRVDACGGRLTVSPIETNRFAF